MGSNAVWYNFTNFLKEPIAFIFRVEALKEVGPPKKKKISSSSSGIQSIKS